MQPVVRLVDFGTYALLAVAGLAMILMAGQIGIDVAGRFLFNAPLEGTTEWVPRYYMVALIFLPLPFIQRINGHFVSGLLTDAMAPRKKEILEGITSLAMGLVVAVLTWCSIGSAIHYTNNLEQVVAGEAVVYAWPSRWIVPAGLGLMAAQAFINALRFFLGHAIPAAPTMEA